MIPITVVTGFLGAGKTSLIAHLLDNTQDRRIAVIVNELAASSIDSAYLHGGEHITLADEPLLRSVSGGRAGAGKESETIDQLVQLATMDPPPDAIVVETSGSSPVAALADRIHQAPALEGHAFLDSVITIIDVTSVNFYWKDPQLRILLHDQLHNADLVILNKMDRAGFWVRRSALALVKRATHHSELISAEFGRIPVEEMIATGRRSTRNAAINGTEQSAVVSNPRFHPVVARLVTEARPFHPERLHQWLDSEWPGVIRVKGFAWLATDMNQVYVIDVAAAQREIGIEGTWYGALPAEERPDAPEISAALASGAWEDRRQTITVIGTPEAVEREMRRLRACLLTDTELDRGPHGWRRLNDPITAQFQIADASPTPE
ncbi:MAG: CobW family GTP-binding protein [Alkalispirochaeta sp.]